MVQAATVSNIELPARMKDMEQNATDDGLSLKRLFFQNGATGCFTWPGANGY